eukprot:SAG31_NODE_5624_length_2417_cov_6.132750_2_plen_109_part_00
MFLRLSSTLRALLVEAGLKDAGIGCAELHAALNGVASVCGIVSPLIWTVGYRAFGRWGKGHWYYSPGGTWLLVAVGRIVVQLLVMNSDKCENEPNEGEEQNGNAHATT